MIRERLARLRSIMAEKNIDFYMIPTSDYHNSEYVSDYFKVRQYYSGFTGSSGTLIVSADSAGLWTDGRYFIQAEQELKDTGITLFRMQEEGVPDIPEYLRQHMKSGQTLGFDGRCVSGREGLEIEKKLEGRHIRFHYKEDIAGSLWEARPELPCGAVRILPEEINGRSAGEKLQQVRDRLDALKADYLMLGKLDDIMWLLNIRGSDIACNPVALSYCLIGKERVYLFLQRNALTAELKAYAAENRIEVKDYCEVEEFLGSFSFEGNVMFDEGGINYSLYRLLVGKSHITGENPTGLLKAVKNDTELSQMERVYLADSAAVIKFIYWLKTHVGKEKITEVSASEYLDSLRRETQGFLDLSFPTISAYKENAAMMHYEATPESHKELKPEGLLLVDSGGQYLGGTTDVTRTVVLGPVSDEIKLHFTKVAAGMLRLTDARFLYGCTGRNLDILARGPLWDIGIDYKCGTGHGIGYILNVHEGPQSIRWRFARGMKEAVIEAGMVISNEPGVYVEGSHGIRTENVIVAKNGEKNGDGQFMYFDTLTYVPIDLEGIDTACMQPEDISRLNRYHEKVYEKMAGYLNREERAWLKEATAALF